MRIVNLGILAHVDAGKTSLTERILVDTGVIDAAGSVDRGNTQTDTLEIERQRGITIQSAVVSFRINDLIVNLIDTPGHSDFIAEVERALGVLDGVVLVVSAAEGVQAQTRRLARAVRELGLPLIIFINKIDRAGARAAALLDDIRQKLMLDVVPLTEVMGIGTPRAVVRPVDFAEEVSASRLLDALAEHDDALIARFLESGSLPPGVLWDALTVQARLGQVIPVYFGSAMLGIGVDLLLDGIARFLPATPMHNEGPVSGLIFKIQRELGGEKCCFARLFSGTLAVRQKTRLVRQGVDGRREEVEVRITGIESFGDGRWDVQRGASPGEIVRLHGLKEAQIGDVIGELPERQREMRFAPPSLESVVRPVDAHCAAYLHGALRQLAEQDPLISVRQDDRHGEISLRLYGEVQKEFIAATLANDFDLDVTMEPSHVVCIESPVGTGFAVEHMGEPGNPFPATVGLQVAPGRLDSGVTFRRPSGALPLAFYKAIEGTVYETLREGLYGWDVRDIAVTVTETAYASPVTVASDFRNLTPLVLMQALKEAGTRVCEPVHRFVLDVPAETVGEVLSALGSCRAMPEQSVQYGSTCQISGTIPLAEIHGFEQRLPGISHGEGLFTERFDSYPVVTGAIPRRARTDLNPLHHKEYLARISQL